MCGDAAGEAAAGGEGILFDVKPAASNDRSFISGSPGGSPGPRSAVREAEAGRGWGWGRGRGRRPPCRAAQRSAPQRGGVSRWARQTPKSRGACCFGKV